MRGVIRPVGARPFTLFGVKHGSQLDRTRGR
jgi:hypothetical protein